MSKSSQSAVRHSTTSEWACIRPQLINWLQNVEKDLIGKRYLATFTSVSLRPRVELASDPSLKVHPREIDIAMLPAVQSLLESAIDSDMSQEDLKERLLCILPPLIRKWSSEAVQELEQVVREQLRLPLLSQPSLLWVIFWCEACSQNCRKRLRFDEALSHHHLYKEKCVEEDKDTREETGAYDKFIMEYSTHPWNIQDLRVDVNASRRVGSLVRSMGHDPSQVTYDELRRSIVEVICGLCNPQDATRMKFEDAVCRTIQLEFFLCC